MSRVPTPIVSESRTLELLRGDSRWNEARRRFSSHCGKIEQAGQQRQALDPLRMRAMAFDAVKEILAVYGVEP